MGFRAVGTNDGSYVAIGGQNAFTMAPEDPTKEYVNIYIDGTAQGVTVVASVQVRYLVDSLKAEGFIKGYTLPDPPPVPLSQVERVAKALMESNDEELYSDKEFRAEGDYLDYIERSKALLEGDNK